MSYQFLLNQSFIQPFNQSFIQPFNQSFTKSSSVLISIMMKVGPFCSYDVSRTGMTGKSNCTFMR